MCVTPMPLMPSALQLDMSALSHEHEEVVESLKTLKALTEVRLH